jgi:spore maturation protein CgeB
MTSINTPYELYWVLGEQKLGPMEYYFAKALKKNGKNVNYINIHDIYSSLWKKYNVYSHRLSRRFDNAIQNKYFKVINDSLINQFNIEKPAVIFIYNDCKILPETLTYFKKKGTRIIVFLGDDPNYLSNGKKTFLLSVMQADSIILPDTGWISGLKLLGINNIVYSPVGTDTDVFFPLEPDESQLNKYRADIIFIGTGYYLNSWGIRRAAILNELSEMDFKIFGDKSWYEIFPYFPDLKKHFTNRMLTAAEVNIACNCGKIYPVVVNAGVINGGSTRIFDCIASGIFILAEYRKDLESLFSNDEIVFFNSKKELKQKAEYFLKHEDEAIEIKEKARKAVLEKYTLDISVKNILEQIHQDLN